MHGVDDRGQHVGVGRRVHAVAEVEDVTGAPGVVGEHGGGAGERDVGAGEHQRRIEVALDRQRSGRGACVRR